MKKKVRVPHYYDTFHCTGGACPDTCCIGWMIEIDEDSYQRFMKMEGEFGDRIRANIIERPDGHFFSLNEDGRCAFLNKDNLCEMVVKMGDESLCSLCDNYPRVGVEYGGLREMGLSFSCPEVARLILSSSKPIRFGEWFQEEDLEEIDYTQDALFDKLMNLRDVVFGILQCRDYSILQRAALLLMIASRVQNALDGIDDVDENYEGRIVVLKDVDAIMEDFSSEEYLVKVLKSIKCGKAEETRKQLIYLLGLIEQLEIINEKWIEIFAGTSTFLGKGSLEQWVDSHQEFKEVYEDQEYVYEHLLVYYVYRYFMKMIFDGDVYSKSVIGIVALLVIREMNVATWILNEKNFAMEDQIKAMYLYSKEIEHCEENMDALADAIWDEDLFQPKSLIDMITNIL